MREQTQTVEAWLEEVRTVRAEIQRAYDHDIAVLLAEITTLRAEQTRLREALEAVKVYWTRYGFSGWKGDDDFDRLSNQIDAALSSTPTPEPSK